MKGASTTKRTEIHIHLPGDLEGPVHVYVHGADVETRTLPTGNGVATTSTDVEQILKRFEAFESTTVARQVHDALVEQGWEAHAPASRNGDSSKASYVRMLYRGTEREVSLFLNTVALVSARAKAKEVAASLEGAELHADESVYLYHDHGKLDQAIAAADALRRWANGEDTPT